MGPSPNLRLLHTKQRVWDQNFKSLWVPDLTYGFVHSKQVSMRLRPHLWFFALKATSLAPELLVYMCPSPHLWLLHAKQRL